MLIVLPLQGSIRAEDAPSSRTTGLHTRIARRGASCATIPAQSIRNTKGSELPSMMGSSGPLTSTTTLSRPLPAKAAIRCSTVDTVVP